MTVAKKKTTKKKTAKTAKVGKKKAVTKKSKATKVTKKKVSKKKVTKKKVTKKVTKKKVTKKKVTTKKVTKKSPSIKKKVLKKAAAPAAPKKPKAKKLPLAKRKYYQNLLLVKRSELFGDITSMEKEALSPDSSNLSHLPVHMADVGSDNYDQDLRLGLMESERKLLEEIDSALDRIADGSYGICAENGVHIRKARLEAKPWAKYCIEVARERERNGHR